MKTPYQILGIATDSTDAEIKHAYLQKVKENPPDHNQEQFQLIHNAYTSIKDIKSRTSYDLFNIPTADFDQFINQALNSEQTVQLTPKHFSKLLFASVDESTIPHIFTNSEK